LVYEITKLTMENNERMVSIHKAAQFSIPENYTKNKVLPWHKGAARWFNENGYTIEQSNIK
ncbi:TAXI family TRAP transporter solute-binding subunit, partial [Marinobacter psychrophilus]